MMKSMLIGLVMALSFSGQVFATDTTTTTTDGSTSMKVDEAKPTTEKNKVTKGEDVDEIITNKKMRAEAGSASKWSIGTALSFYGGTLEKPLNEKRPNLAGSNAPMLNSYFGGTVGVGYKMNTTNRLSLDAGFRWITPFQNDVPKGYTGNRRQAENPSLTYSKMYKFSDVQSVFSFGPTFYTSKNARDNGQTTSWGISQNNVYEIGKTGLSLGVYVFADAVFFDKNDEASRMDQTNWDFGIDPIVEYVINDTFNLRTVFNWNNYDHHRTDKAGTFAKNENTQSVGVGISVTRDIFLYPNIQFRPYNITHVFRSDDTNVALSTNINLF